jgi:hypothetical protein
MNLTCSSIDSGVPQEWWDIIMWFITHAVYCTCICVMEKVAKKSDLTILSLLMAPCIYFLALFVSTVTDISARLILTGYFWGNMNQSPQEIVQTELLYSQNISQLWAVEVVKLIIVIVTFLFKVLLHDVFAYEVQFVSHVTITLKCL